METKICNCCHIEKSISEFSKKYKTKSGEQKYQSKCKNCTNIESELYRINNIQNRKIYDKHYYIENKEKILKNKKEYHQKNQEIILQKKKEYRDKPETKILQKEYRKNNREYLNEIQDNYRNNNPHVVAWRSILYRVIKQFGNIKEKHTIDLLGYSAEDLKIHMENLFKEGMNWNNHGEWHIDHIIPLSTFSIDTPINIVNALSNLQPLWKIDNLKKSNKIV